MERNIYLFTNTFPYGNGETFLMNEIKYLADNFQSVFIIPLQADKNIREVPPNVIILKPLLSVDTKKDRLKFILSGLCNLSPIMFALTEWKISKPYKDSKKTWEFFTFLFRFRCIYKRQHINPKKNDILYFYWGDKSVMLAPVLKQKYSSTIVVRFHGSDLYEEVKASYIPFRRYVFPSIDKFITISDYGRRYLLGKYPQLVNENKIFVSRLGVLDQGVNLINRTDVDCFHLVSCSNLVEIKRIQLIIKALHLIEFKIKWTHIGDGPLRSVLQAMSYELPDNIEVNWLGLKTNEEVIKFYQENYIDLFINVSSTEGIPVSIMEAMSFGIPAMATDVGGVSELVNNSNGILLPSRIDEAFLADMIQEFVKKNNVALRENAREHWEQNFNAEQNYHAFIQLLKDF